LDLLELVVEELSELWSRVAVSWDIHGGQFSHETADDAVVLVGELRVRLLLVVLVFILLLLLLILVNWLVNGLGWLVNGNSWLVVIFSWLIVGCSWLIK
jgi:hypothetical protein